eukprot:1092-Eustigmatos_ZCMA.PRE.1
MKSWPRSWAPCMPKVVASPVSNANRLPFSRGLIGPVAHFSLQQVGGSNQQMDRRRLRLEWHFKCSACTHYTLDKGGVESIVHDIGRVNHRR